MTLYLILYNFGKPRLINPATQYGEDQIIRHTLISFKSTTGLRPFIELPTLLWRRTIEVGVVSSFRVQFL